MAHKIWRNCMVLAACTVIMNGCSEDETNKAEQTECLPGQSECVGTSFSRTCEKGLFKYVPCETGCNAATGACNAVTATSCVNMGCSAGKTCNVVTGLCEDVVMCDASAYPQCAGNARLTCIQGKVVSTPCGDDFSCQNGECVAGQHEPTCEDGTFPKCYGNDAVTCVSGQIVTTPCGEQSCVNGVCVDPGVSECDIQDYPKCSGDSILICASGKIMSVNCNDGETCQNGLCVKKGTDSKPECNETDYPKCDTDNESVLSCISGKVFSTPCGSDEVCRDGVCEALPTCLAKDYPKCDADGKAVLTCQSGKVVSNVCKANETCIGGKCAEASCEPEAKMCRNGLPATCSSSGKWVIGSCGSGEICQNGECVQHGLAPKVTSCGTLTVSSGKVCEKTGSGKKLVLRGDVLGLNETWLGGSVVIENDKITYAGCDPDLSGAVVVTCPDSVISPAFINAHEHLTFSNGAPAVWNDERFDHRHDWRKGKNGHTKVPGPNTSVNNGNSVVEFRALLAGTTSIFGSGSAPGMARNLDVKSSTVGNVTSVYQTFPLDDSGGEQYESGCDYSYHKTVTNFDSSCPYGPHIAEGINQAALNEMRCLSGEGAGSKNIFKPNTAVIHGIGATLSMIQKMSDNNVKLIWSPRTNISLYGDTAQAPLYDRMGVLIGLGTDWIYSGSANMLRELKCVDYLNRNHYSLYFSDYEIWKMPTYNNAKALGVDKYLGQIAAGFVADVVMFKKTKIKDLYRAVIESENEDVMLVTMNGKRIYGNSELMDSGEEFEVCKTKKKFDFEAADTKSDVASYKAMDAAKAYGMFFCKTPENEPTCVPARTRNEDTGKQHTTNYDGDFTASDDADGDGIKDDFDNCPTMFNPVRPMDTDRKQVDTDSDTIGDICDEYPNCAANNKSCINGGETVVDTDGDTIPDDEDNCPEIKNSDQADSDDDGIGDVCDSCPNGDSGCSFKSHTLDFSCTSCKSGSGYSATYQETIDGAIVSAVGNVGKYQATNGITLTGDSSKATKIEITNLSGVGSITVKYISYNPSNGKGTLLIESGSFASQLVHTYDKNAIVEITTKPYEVNDKSATSILLVPEEGAKGKTADHRIHITGVTWTSFE